MKVVSKPLFYRQNHTFCVPNFIFCFYAKAIIYYCPGKIGRMICMTRTLGCTNVPKVLNFMVNVDFPIHLDPRTSPSEKISIFFEIYYWCKPVEVLPSKLPSSDFGQSECGSKNP